jgi:hypothetical protein
MKKVRIVSEDGTTKNTHVYDDETGVEIRGINYLRIGPTEVKDALHNALIGLIFPKFDMKTVATFYIHDPRFHELQEKLELAGYEIVAKKEQNEKIPC